ncbi:hypothetical protein V6N12_007270 [Hibiscus sabdariffa]|uniref:Reverse transcriptase zinc-binding domain-containing protein n=1 Tax=Hibiscus sabdariffa TaxID=183260 RepID=A0ABR2F1A7_9ROSI
MIWWWRFFVRLPSFSTTDAVMKMRWIGVMLLQFTVVQPWLVGSLFGDLCRIWIWGMEFLNGDFNAIYIGLIDMGFVGRSPGLADYFESVVPGLIDLFGEIWVQHGPLEPLWKVMVGFKGLPRVKTFMWLVCHEITLTNERA